MAYKINKAEDVALGSLVPVATPHVISSALSCPWKYYVDFYLDRIDTRTPYNALTGLITHYFIDRYLNPSVEIDLPLPPIAFDLYKQIRSSYEFALQDTIAYGLDTEDKLYKAPEFTRYYSLTHAKKYVEAIRYLNNLDEIKDSVHTSGSQSIFYAINQAEKCFYTFLKWYEAHKETLKDIKTEYRLSLSYLDKHPCSGTIDLLATVDYVTHDELTVIDYKTSFQAYTEEELRNTLQMQWYAYFSGATAIEILNLRAGTVVKVLYTSEEMKIIEKKIKNKIKQKRAIDKLCVHGKVSSSTHNPLGTRSYSCPCPLLETKDKETHCIFDIRA